MRPVTGDVSITPIRPNSDLAALDIQPIGYCAGGLGSDSISCNAVDCPTPALLHRRLVVLVIGLIHYDRFQNDLFRGRLLAQIADRNLSGETALVKPIVVAASQDLA